MATSNANMEWTLPSSESAKRRLSGMEWGTVTDTYLWYLLDGVDSLVEGEQRRIVESFFEGGHAGFGDVEIHRSSIIPGQPFILRLRGRLRLLPSLQLRGAYRPLYQIGHSDDSDRLNFHNRWNGMSAESAST